MAHPDLPPPDPDLSDKYGGNKIPWKLASGVVLTIFALLGGVYAMNEIYLPREVYEAKCEITDTAIAGLSKQVLVSQLLNQRFYWQQKADEYAMQLRHRPNDRWLIQKYNEAIRKRDDLDRQIRQLQAQ